MGNYLGSSIILRCWRQLYLDPRRQITTVMPTPPTQATFFSFFHARPVIPPGQCFMMSDCHCLPYSSLPRFLFMAACLPVCWDLGLGEGGGRSY